MVANVFMCKDGMPCDSIFVDKDGRGICQVVGKSKFRMKHGSVYFCYRIQLRGGQGWGMSLYEKLERQGLLSEYKGAENEK